MNGSEERLVFESHQVRRWADFSGDYNPIHFQNTRAIRAGLRGIVAHGMLVLIPAKRAASAFSHSHAPDEDRQFKAFFKKPVPLGEPCFLRIDGTHRSLQFKIESEKRSNDHSTESYVRGSYGVAKDRVAAIPRQTFESTLDWREISPTMLQTRADEYARIYDMQPVPLWAFLGSLVFSEYVRTSLDKDVARWLDAPTDSQGVCNSRASSWVEREDITVLQTAFSLRHCPQLHADLAETIGTITVARWRRTAIDAVDTPSETIGSISLELETTSGKAYPEIEIELTLIAKKTDS